MISERLKEKIKAIVGNKSVFDNSGFFIAYPSSVSDLQRLLKFIVRENLKVKIIGNGHSLKGNVNISKSLENTIYVSSKKINEIFLFDSEFGYLTVGSGITFEKLLEYLKNQVWCIPLDIAENKLFTLGGLLGSLRNFSKFGAFIHGVEVVLASGEVIDIGGCFLPGSSGYDLQKIFIGTFGSFGFITKITLKLINTSNCNTFIEKISNLKVKEDSLIIDDIFKKLKKKLDADNLFLK